MSGKTSCARSFCARFFSSPITAALFLSACLLFLFSLFFI